MPDTILPGPRPSPSGTPSVIMDAAAQEAAALRDLAARAGLDAHELELLQFQQMLIDINNNAPNSLQIMEMNLDLDRLSQLGVAERARHLAQARNAPRICPSLPPEFRLQPFSDQINARMRLFGETRPVAVEAVRQSRDFALVLTEAESAQIRAVINRGQAQNAASGASRLSQTLRTGGLVIGIAATGAQIIADLGTLNSISEVDRAVNSISGRLDIIQDTSSTNAGTCVQLQTEVNYLEGALAALRRRYAELYFNPRQGRDGPNAGERQVSSVFDPMDQKLNSVKTQLARRCRSVMQDAQNALDPCAQFDILALEQALRLIAAAKLVQPGNDPARYTQLVTGESVDTVTNSLRQMQDYLAIGAVNPSVAKQDIDRIVASLDRPNSPLNFASYSRLNLLTPERSRFIQRYLTLIKDILKNLQSTMGLCTPPILPCAQGSRAFRCDCAEVSALYKTGAGLSAGAGDIHWNNFFDSPTIVVDTAGFPWNTDDPASKWISYEIDAFSTPGSDEPDGPTHEYNTTFNVDDPGKASLCFRTMAAKCIQSITINNAFVYHPSAPCTDPQYNSWKYWKINASNIGNESGAFFLAGANTMTIKVTNDPYLTGNRNGFRCEFLCSR